MNNESNNRLLSERKRLNLYRSHLSDMCEVSEQTIKRWESGTPIPSDKLSMLAQNGFDTLYIITGERQSENDDEYFNVPLYKQKASAGHGHVVHSDNIKSYIPFKKEFLHNQLHVQPNDCGIIEGKGDSMEPLILDGEYIMFDTSDNTIGIDRAGVYVFSYNDGIYVKALHRAIAGDITASSKNPLYPRFIIPANEEPESLHIIGRVVWPRMY